MKVPKKLIYRAMVKRGMLEARDIPAIDRRLNANPEAQKELEKLWRTGKGRSGKWTRLADIGQWLWERREIIMRILGVAVMFLDEEPAKAAEPIQEKPKRVRKPKPVEYDLGLSDTGAAPVALDADGTISE